MRTLQNPQVVRTIPILIAVCLISVPIQAKYGGGSGTADDPYQIAAADDLIALGETPEDYNKHFILTADIDLAGHVFYKAVIASFTGVFDGNGHTISHLTIIDGSNRGSVGLFGQLASEAEVKNLELAQVSVVGSGYEVGALVGRNEGDVTGCSATGKIVGDNYAVGGLVGLNYAGHVSRCHSVCTVSASADVDSMGGLAGVNSGGSVIYCYSAGTVSIARSVAGIAGSDRSDGLAHVSGIQISGGVPTPGRIGGLVGTNYASVAQSYSIASVTGTSRVGGLVGYNWGSITTSYSTGAVSGTTYVGGLLGDNIFGSITSSFWDIETSGQTTGAGGTGKTTAEMQTASTFLDAGWDFVGPADGPADVWSEPEGGGYPILWWQPAQWPSLPTFSGGTGQRDDPYLISTPQELNSIGSNPRLMESHFKLIADVNLVGVRFYTIGNGPGYAGGFDGDGHAISNLACDSNEVDSIGLFGYVRGGTIKNLELINPKIDAGTGDAVGSLVGDLAQGSVTNCHASGGAVSARDRVGGLVGWTEGGTLTQCSSTGVVNGEYYVGGLVGCTDYGTLTQCYSAGTVTADGNGVGGLVGQSSGGSVANCYASGTVSGSSDVGGLVGENVWWGPVVTHCYSAGAVSGVSHVGGLVGNNGGDLTQSYSVGAVTGREDVGGLVGTNESLGRVIGCFWDIRTSGQTTSAGGIGLITSEMQKAATFFEWGTCGNEGIWTIDDANDYPRLWWEKRAGKPIAPPKLSDLLLGTGSPDDPFLIYTPEQLYIIGLLPCEWDKHFKLMADIDLSAFDGKDGRPAFKIIAPAREEEADYVGPYPVGVPFTGVFDGNGHAILNFTYTSTDAINVYVGLFGYVIGQIKNLGLIDPNVLQGSVADETAGAAGCLVGCLQGGTISGCYIRGGNVKGVHSVGGLVGLNGGTVSDCWDTGIVRGTENVGGVAGFNEGSMTRCYSTGTVTADGNGVGGLVGYSGGIVTMCQSTATVTGGSNVGGLVGETGWTFCWNLAGNIAGQSGLGTVSTTVNGRPGEAGTLHACIGPAAPPQPRMCPGRVTLCRSSGSVNGVQCVGGLVGLNEATLSDCYSSGPANGADDVGGLVGSNSDTVTNCYSTGAVSGGSNVGGLVGWNGGGTVTACFWDTQTSGQATSAAGTGETTTQMQDMQTYRDAGWDFVAESQKGTEDIWAICEGVDYPRLAWEFVIGDFDADADTDFADFCILAEHWLAADGSFWCGQGCDLTNDGSVNWQDLMFFAQSWLTGMGP